MLKKITLLLVVISMAAGAGGFYYVFVAQGQTGQKEVINQEIQELNNDIGQKRQKIRQMQEKQEKYSRAIKQKQAEKSTLNNQLSILENRLAKARLDIEMVETDINRTELEIQKIDNDIKQKEKAIQEERESIENVLRMMYKRNEVSSLEIILLNDSLADFLSQVKYLEDINQGVRDSLKQLEKLKGQLQQEKQDLSKERSKLTELKRELESKQEKLEAEKEKKFYLLEQVDESEEEYRRLLAAAKREQEAAAADIATMEKVVRAKLAKLEGKKLELNENGLIWPVTKNVITAYFHDPEYPFRHIFEHPGVDIRSSHGSTLRSAASGYVARTKKGADGSYGYIMIVHGDGLSTVYGHVSQIDVEEDEFVVQGQKIGQTGGLPGTPGAGRLTTGPHLHFEVRRNGIPVDPLGYLP